MMTREYGKITGWWNKKNITGIDLGDVIEVIISREGTKNSIKNLDLVTSGWNRDWSYLQISYFLKTLKTISQISIEGQECTILYDDTYFLIRYGLKNPMTQCHYSIFQMRILKSLGSMNPELFENDPILKYIYNNISTTPLERILSANIKNIHIETIEQINLNSLYTLER